MSTTLSVTLEELLGRFLTFLPSLVTSLVVFVITLFLAGLTSRGLQQAFERRGADPETSLLVSKITRWAVIVLGVVIALEQVNFDVTAFLAGLGILGFTVGFALQDVSKNFIAGLLLLLQRPFEIGEQVEVGGFTGVVKAVDLRATLIRTLDGRHVLIPNADVFVNPIVNHSRAESRRIELGVGVSYESNLEQVRQTALDAIRSVKGVLDDPAPQVVYHTFGGSTVDLTLYYWVDTSQTNPLTAKDEGLALVKVAFEDAEIDMPFPTQALILQGGAPG